MAITVKQINEDFSGDPSNLYGKRVSTPGGGEGKIISLWSRSKRGEYGVRVSISRNNRENFSLNDVDLV